MLRRSAGIAVAALVLCGVAPAYADPSATPSGPEKAAAPDLKITVGVETRDYVINERIPVTVTIQNVGDAEATAVKGKTESTGSFFTLPPAAWQKFDPSGSGGTIAAGQSAKLEMTAQVQSFNGDSKVKFSVEAKDEATPDNNVQEVTVPIVSPDKKATVSGIVYGDKDRDNGFDNGEGLANVKLDLESEGGADRPVFHATTDSTGKFEIKDVPARRYFLRFNEKLPDGWVSAGREVVVAGAAVDLRVQAVRPLSETLKATVKFNEGPYKPGDTANLTVTLTNDGDKAVTKVRAHCDRGDNGSPHLAGTSDPNKWGALAGAGVTVGAHQAASFPVSGTVPDDAKEHGVVIVACDFGNAAAEEGFPSAFALAKVPGLNGTSKGQFYHDKNDDHTIGSGEAVTGLEVVLTDPLDGSEVAKAKTDSNGLINFGTPAAGWYVPVFHGPWKLLDEQFIRVSAGDRAAGWALRLVPGPDKTPTKPEEKAKDRDTTPALANTGADDVTGIALVGFSLLILGAGAVVAGRPRRRLS